MPAPLKLGKKLLRRELDGERGPGSPASLYGSRMWVDNLDISNELHGHIGCINALAWSRDGNLLATGSDDDRINIYSANAGFSLNTRIETGHQDNIFSVKFMPHSSDRTLVSAAADHEVRVFDIEYAPTTFSSPESSSPPRPSGYRRVRPPKTLRNPRPGKYYMAPSKVYRSHVDRVKRIITESSPHLFLTCSEDGTVRQFDLRQPSEFYRSPESGNQGTYRSFPAMTDEEDERNPPLISYRRHHIELNTISCSTSQPHYIALGGGHLHCFLHDRRMLGRDHSREAGQSYNPSGSSEASSNESRLSAATQCVRRFAPRMGDKWDKHIQNSHITACKISDAHPNEIVVSWSGDGAYLFDINRSPAPNDKSPGRDPWDPERKRSRVKAERARKRQRNKSPSTSSDSNAEEIVPGQSMIKLASLVVGIRTELFGLSSVTASDATVHPTVPETEVSLEERKTSYDEALRLAHVSFKRICRAIPILDEQDVQFLATLDSEPQTGFIQRQRNLRRALAKNRRRVRAFVKAAGCLAHTLGGTVAEITDYGMSVFEDIGSGLNDTTSFRYRMLQAAVSFVKEGTGGVRDLAREESLSDVEDAEDQRDILETYLLELENMASESSLVEVDLNEPLFDSEKALVRAFRSVINLATAEGEAGNSPPAKRFWGEKVARALLMKEATGIDFQFVDKAFEGIPEDDNDVAVGEIHPGAEIYDPLLQTLVDVVEEEDEDVEMFNDEPPGLEDIEEDTEENEDDEDEDDDPERDSEDDLDDDFWVRRRQHRRNNVESQAPTWEHTKAYRGHCNVRTVKDINFYGLDDEYVISGSDCGHLFFWDKKSTELVQLLHADDETCNVAVGHPYQPMLAVSGIDYTVKIFSPDTLAQKQFATTAFPSASRTDGGAADEGRDEDGDLPFAGKHSRRRMHNSYSITSQNAVMAESGLSGRFVSRGLLAQVVARMRNGEGIGTEGGDGCEIM